MQVYLLPGGLGKWVTGGAALRGRHRTVLAGTEARPTHYVDAHPLPHTGRTADNQ